MIRKRIFQLKKCRLMRIDKVHIYDFKNLKDFDINLDRKEMYAVLLGQNAAGKSNLLEALVIIFRDLYLDNDPAFSYDIEYHCNEFQIRIMARHDAKSKKERYWIFLRNTQDESTLFPTDEEITRSRFKREQNKYLPRYVIAYYSGASNRLEEHFDPHQKIFYRDLLAGEDDPLRPLFYARPIHSNFVLMSFFSFPEEDEKIDQFLRDYFGIIGLDSILFVLKRPHWAKQNRKSRKLIENNQISFYKAKGTVSRFLKELYQIALAPIQDEERVPVDFRREETEELVYLYISNVDKLRKLSDQYVDNLYFFKVLESTYISDFIHDVRIKVKKLDSEGNITFKEMSEGEQQLLSVLGLLRFTKSDESLILLDEPDTHLNPIWKWRYIKLLRDIVDKPKNTQIIMTSHDPLVIGSLRKEEIRMFYQDKEQGKIVTDEPSFDPKGLGVAGILTSEFFGLPSILDEETLGDLNRKRELEVLDRSKKLSPTEESELERLEKSLDKLGLEKVQRDPLYQKFIQAVYSIPELKQPPKNKEERDRQNEKMVEVLKEIMQEEKNQ